MNEITILHLSDLHFGVKKAEFVSQERKDQAIEAFHSLYHTLLNLPIEWHPQIIAISGDIGWAGKQDDYKQAWDWIKNLLTVLNLTTNNLVICTGNHDQDRMHLDSIKAPNDPLKADNMLRIGELEKRCNPFRNFINFYRAHSIKPLILNEKQNYLIGSQKLLDLQFIILNSAWFTEKGNSERGKLFVGLPHIRNLKVSGKLVEPENYDSKMITIVLLHHPPEWLHQSELDSYGNRLATYAYLAGQSHIILSGHTHGEVINNPDKKYGGALLFKIGATAEDQPYKNNCQILKINIKTRYVDRLKLYYEPGEAIPRWRVEIDHNGSYDLRRRRLEELSDDEVIQRMVDILKEDPSLLTKLQSSIGSCNPFLRNFINVLTLLLPLQIPGIESGYPIASIRQTLSSTVIQGLQIHVNELDKIKSDCLNLKSDWLSQRAWFLAGNFWYFIKEYEKALDYYKDIEGVTPVYDENKGGKSFPELSLTFNLGVTLGKLGDYLEAKKMFKNITKLNPTNAKAFGNWGVALSKLGQYNEAIEKYEQAINLESDLAESFYNWGYALSKLGQFEKAIIKYEQACHLNSSLKEAFHNWGTALAALKQHKKAIKKYKQAYKLDPTYVDSLYNWGNALNELGRYEEAIIKYKTVMKLEPTHFDAIFNLGNALNGLKRYEEAIMRFEHAAKIDSTNPDLYNNWGIALAGLNQYERASKKYKRAIQINPTLAEAYYNWGHALIELENYQEAIKKYDIVLQFEPKNSMIWYAKGIALLKETNYKEALRSFNQVIVISPNEPYAYYYLACIYAQLKRPSDSFDYLKQAISRHKNKNYFIERCRRDPYFKYIKHLPKFKTLTAEKE